MRSFDLYASNNTIDWTLLGQFDIGDPSDENGNIPQDFIDAAANGHDFDLEGVSETFQYLKFSTFSCFIYFYIQLSKYTESINPWPIS